MLRRREATGGRFGLRDARGFLLGALPRGGREARGLRDLTVGGELRGNGALGLAVVGTGGVLRRPDLFALCVPRGADLLPLGRAGCADLFALGAARVGGDRNGSCAGGPSSLRECGREPTRVTDDLEDCGCHGWGSALGEEGLQGAEGRVLRGDGDGLQRGGVAVHQSGDEEVCGEVSEELGLVRVLAQAASSITMARSVGAS